MTGARLRLFYEEPDPDRWFPFDRYPRRVIRALVRGETQPRGTMRAFLNLVDGLDRIGAPYRINVMRALRAATLVLWPVCSANPHVLDKIPRQSPCALWHLDLQPSETTILACPAQRDIRQVLVPSEWVCRMFEQGLARDLVSVWPVGIDTDRWKSGTGLGQETSMSSSTTRSRGSASITSARLSEPLLCRAEASRAFGSRPCATVTIARKRCSRSASDAGPWSILVGTRRRESPHSRCSRRACRCSPGMKADSGKIRSIFPRRREVRAGDFGTRIGTTRCGVKFRGGDDLLDAFDVFWKGVEAAAFSPRDMVVERLTLERCATEYVALVRRFGG